MNFKKILKPHFCFILLFILAFIVGFKETPFHAQRKTPLSSGNWEILPSSTVANALEFREQKMKNDYLKLWDFNGITFKHPGVEKMGLSLIKARILFEEQNFISILINYSQKAHYMFRLSSSPKYQSGFYKFQDGNLTKKVVLDKLAPQKCLLNVKIAEDQGVFKAFLDDVLICEFIDNDIKHGTVGLLGELLTPVFVKEVIINGQIRNNDRIDEIVFKENFSLSSSSSIFIKVFNSLILTGIIFSAWFITFRINFILMPGLDKIKIRYLTAYIYCLLLTVLLLFSFSTVFLLIFISVLFVSTGEIILILKYKESCIVHNASAKRINLYNNNKFLLSLILGNFVLSFLLCISIYIKDFIPEEQSAQTGKNLKVQPYSLQEPIELKVGSPWIHEKYDWADISLSEESPCSKYEDFDFSMDFLFLEPGNFEIFFRKTGFASLLKDDWIPEWYALRISSEKNTGSGFIKSSTSMPPGVRFCAKTNTLYHIDLCARGSIFKAWVEKKLIDVLKDRELVSGSIGIVENKGLVRIQDIEIIPVKTSSVKKIAALWLKLFFYFLIFLLMSTFLIDVMSNINVRLIVIHLLLISIISNLFLFFIVLTNDIIFLNYSGHYAPVFALFLINSVFFWLYCSINKNFINYYGFLPIIFLIFICVMIEFIIRDSALNRKWDASLTGGYVKDKFLLWRLDSGSRIWGSYINSFGFRGEEVPVEKEANEVRIICLGGSTTFGTGVENPGDSYPAKLKELLNYLGSKYKYKVINAGIPGYTSFQGLKLLERDLLKFRPDIITLCFGINDDCDSPLTQRQIFERSDKFPQGFEKLTDFLRTFRIYGGLSRGIFNIVEKSGILKSYMNKTKKVPVDDFKNNLLSFIELSHENNFDVLFIPEIKRDIYDKSSTVFPYHNAMKEISLKYNIPVVPVVEGFLNKGECQYFSDFVHMNKPGNEFFAEIVFKSIVSLEKMRKLNGWNASTPTPESLLNLVQCNMSTFIERLPWYEDKDKNFNSDGGYCYIFDLPGDVKWEMWDDTNASPEYHVYLYENNELLPFPRTVNHDEIRVKGMGRYSHWQDRIYFSTTDNSNPNKNSRSYRIKYY